MYAVRSRGSEIKPFLFIYLHVVDLRNENDM